MSELTSETLDRLYALYGAGRSKLTLTMPVYLAVELGLAEVDELGRVWKNPPKWLEGLADGGKSKKGEKP